LTAFLLTEVHGGSLPSLFAARAAQGLVLPPLRWPRGVPSQLEVERAWKQLDGQGGTVEQEDKPVEDAKLVAAAMKKLTADSTAEKAGIKSASLKVVKKRPVKSTSECRRPNSPLRSTPRSPLRLLPKNLCSRSSFRRSRRCVFARFDAVRSVPFPLSGQRY
jgi:hypothetical protein